MPDLARHIDSLVSRYPDVAPHRSEVERAHALLLDRVTAGGRILLAGNGGSASDASHVAAELLKSLARPRPLSAAERAAFGPEGADLAERLEGAIPAISLPDQGAIHSAFANDVAAEYAFAQLVWALGRPGDVLWVFSTSGRSRNVVHALRTARARGIATLGLLGRGGGDCAPLCDVALIAPGADTQHVQERHLPIYHCLCMMLEEAIFARAEAS